MAKRNPLAPFEVALTEANLIVMLAICAVHDRCGRVTYRAIRAEVNRMTGVKSVCCAHYHKDIIPKLKKLGWIKFDITKQGTIVPLRRFEFFPESIGIKKNVAEENRV
jgi:hypothetical protein